MQSHRPSDRCLGIQAGHDPGISRNPCFSRFALRMTGFSAEDDCPIEREDLNPIVYLFYNYVLVLVHGRNLIAPEASG